MFTLYQNEYPLRICGPDEIEALTPVGDQDLRIRYHGHPRSFFPYLDAFEKVPGRTVVPVSEASRRAFRDAARVVLRKYPAMAELIKEIHAAGEIPLLATAATAASPA